jgi:2-polyprenyl-6-methoxyphenol hydroxylase-like FAD-dependent oxidoreductase
MTHVAVVGAGTAGLAASLFLARRGHTISLIEKDAEDPPADPEACFETWSRRGVAQARQPHLMSNRSSIVMREEAPDVLDAIVAGGARLLTRAMESVAPDHQGLPYSLASRRLPFEATLRRETLKEPGVRLLSGVGVTGLLTRSGADVPIVEGLCLDDGVELRADYVIDASGRFSQLPQWLAAIGAESMPETFQDCGYCYISRWYRLRPGENSQKPPLPIPIVSPFAGFVGFPADLDVICINMMMSTRDPLRGAMRKGEVFDRVISAIPLLEPWLSASDPIGEPYVMARIENRWRSLLRDGRLVIRGLALVGDSAVHTNPNAGRGVTMGYMQAQQLARTVDGADLQSAAFSEAFEIWRAKTLGTWFHHQAADDAARQVEIERALDGEPPLEPTTESVRFFGAVRALLIKDPDVALAFGRFMHMLTTPEDLAANPVVRAAVARHFEAGGGMPPYTGPTRAEFEALAAGRILTAPTVRETLGQADAVG